MNTNKDLDRFDELIAIFAKYPKVSFKELDKILYLYHKSNKLEEETPLYYVYGNGGNIIQVKNRDIDSQHYFANSHKEILEKSISDSITYKNITIQDLYIKFYSYDLRIKRNVYMIVCKKSIQGFKNTFVKYFILNKKEES